tara:strand:- start:242 stop:454 length:213 start_codon:yes stop_codon:yes gene_type:complete
MKRTNKRELNLNKPSFDLNKFSLGCAPCLNEALKIDRQIGKRSLNEMKIEEIKKIVRSIFQGFNNDIKKN